MPWNAGRKISDKLEKSLSTIIEENFLSFKKIPFFCVRSVKNSKPDIPLEEGLD